MKAELAEALAEQATSIQEKVEELFESKLKIIKVEIIESIDKIKNDCEKMDNRLTDIEKKQIELEKDFQSNLQYQRNCNVVISGIPSSVDHDELEETINRIFNKNISKIEVFEHLTPYISKLGYICRNLKRNGSIGGTKIQKGVVKIWFRSQWFNILHEQDLVNILPDYTMNETQD